MRRPKALIVMGTRPEAIKLAPLIWRLKERGVFELRLCLTAQHRDMLDAMLRTFRLKAHIDLDLMRHDQSPRDVLKAVRNLMDGVLKRERPDLVIVQGDTTSALGAALAAARLGIPIAHVEAGLRSFDPRHPYPEENNRVRIDRVAELLFAPTPIARRNLLREGLERRNIHVTGNTGVDSFLWAVRRRHPLPRALTARLAPLPRLAVITLHRRESFGRPLERIFKGMRQAAELLPDVAWVYPVHPNPHVRRAAPRFLRHPRITLTKPLDYLDFVRLLKKASFIVTDSGGIQEEAPSLGKPVLVIREKTERPELLSHGGRLIGIAPENLVREVLRIASQKSKPVSRRNPFGDGRAAYRISCVLSEWAGRRGQTRAQPCGHQRYNWRMNRQISTA